MDWGMQNRLSSILSPESGRCVMLAVDHGYFQGPTTGLQKPGETVAPLLEHADSLMLTRGVLRSTISADVRIPIVLRASGGTSILNDDLSDEDRTLVEEQKICPVSEESLWGMETPVKVSVTDSAGVEHQVFVCCGGCKGKLEADPDKYLAVLEK